MCLESFVGRQSFLYFHNTKVHVLLFNQMILQDTQKRVKRRERASESEQERERECWSRMTVLCCKAWSAEQLLSQSQVLPCYSFSFSCEVYSVNCTWKMKFNKYIPPAPYSLATFLKQDCFYEKTLPVLCLT